MRIINLIFCLTIAFVTFSSERYNLYFTESQEEYMCFLMDVLQDEFGEDVLKEFVEFPFKHGILSLSFDKKEQTIDPKLMAKLGIFLKEGYDERFIKAIKRQKTIVICYDLTRPGFKINGQGRFVMPLTVGQFTNKWDKNRGNKSRVEYVKSRIKKFKKNWVK